MDFISVTLIEKYKSGKVSNLKQEPEYWLPIDGIKSIAPIAGQLNSYYISILPDYIPTDRDFEIGSAEAYLPKGFFRILNEQRTRS